MDEDLLHWMKTRECIYLPKSYYLDFHPDLRASMRAILFEWLMDVADEYKLHRDTVGTTFNFIDRFLSKVPSVQKTRLQLVGVASLLIASKLEDLNPLKVK